MTITVFVRCCVGAALMTTALGCDPVTTPSPIGDPPSSLSLGGTWTGSIGEPSANTALRATWTASQAGNNVTGPIALSNAAGNVSFSGTLTGTLSGTRLSLTYTIPRGRVPDFAECSMSGTGSTEASNTLMSGLLNITYTNCQGFSAQTSGTESVRLTKE